jgi:hypothetical protein
VLSRVGAATVREPARLTASEPKAGGATRKIVSTGASSSQVLRDGARVRRRTPRLRRAAVLRESAGGVRR